MRRRQQKSNTVAWVAIIIFALVVFALVPVVGNWILDEFIYPDDTQPNQDTVAPVAQGKHIVVYSKTVMGAEAFVDQMQDASAVQATFVEMPDWNKEGTQTVNILLTDAAGNTTTIAASFTYIKDTEKPVISGTKDLQVYVGDAVSYKSGVTVTDNYDTKPTLTVDNSRVNLSTPGTYTVTYTATDVAGNASSVSIKVTVMEKPANFVEPEVIYARVDALLDKFITDNMTDREKAEAVYVWTRRASSLVPGPGHFTYSGSTSRNDDYLQAAYEFLDLKKGDCFYFYAIQKLMLERLNIPTIDVKKVKNTPEDTNHYWLLVSVDGGKTYYHFDNVWSPDLCLVTDAKLASVSASVESNPFNRDESLYPATPTQALPQSDLPWTNPAIHNAKP